MEMIKISFDNLLDVRGDNCPLPSLKSKKILKLMEPGEILKIITDHQPATQSVPGYLEKKRHIFLGMEEIFMEENEESTNWAMYFQRRKKLFDKRK